MQESKSLFLRFGIIIISVFAASAIAASWLATHFTNTAMLAQNRMALEAVLKSRARNVEEQYRTSQMQVGNMASSVEIVTAVKGFSDALAQLEEDVVMPSEQVEAELAEFYVTEFATRVERSDVDVLDYFPESSLERLAQWIYIVENPNPVGKKNGAFIPAVQSRYQEQHDRYHAQLNRYLKSFSFYDVFLFDRTARMVYSSRKETDFALDFNRGPYADSNLGDVVRVALASDRNTVITSDLDHYAPSYFEPASFFSAPVFDGNSLIGVVAFQISNELINKIVADVHGLRESGETYIVGEDLYMRTDSRFIDDTTILKQRVDTAASRAVAKGETGGTITPDYRGVSVVSQYRPLNIDGVSWGMLAEIDEAEVREPARVLGKRLRIVLVATLAFVAAITYALFSFGVKRPLGNIAFTASRIIKGDYAARNAITSNDEFSVIAQGQNQTAEAVQSHVKKLEEAIQEVKDLKGLLPMCAYCKSIRDDDGYFRTVETYLVGKSNLEFSHTFCDQCAERMENITG